MEPGKRIQVRWSTGRAGELRGEIVWGASDDVPRKIVFLDGYRAERAGSYRGTLPGNGEEWICNFVRDTQPDNARKGAFIVRLAEKAVERWEIVGETDAELFGVPVSLELVGRCGLRPLSRPSSDLPAAIVRRQEEHRVSLEAARARLRVIVARLVENQPRSIAREVEVTVSEEGLRGTLRGYWASKVVGETSRTPPRRSWTFRVEGSGHHEHLGHLGAPVFDGLVWAGEGWDLAVTDLHAAKAQLGEPQRTEKWGSSLKFFWDVVGFPCLMSNTVLAQAVGAPSLVRGPEVSVEGWVTVTVQWPGLAPQQLTVGCCERSRQPSSASRRRVIEPARATGDFAVLSEDDQASVLKILRRSIRSTFAHEVEYLAARLERHAGKYSADLRGVLALPENFDAILRRYTWDEVEGGDDDPHGGWREMRFTVTGHRVDVIYADAEGKQCAVEVGAWSYVSTAPVVVVDGEELSFAGNADENRYNAVRVLLHRMKEKFSCYREEMRSTVVLPATGELDKRIYDGSPVVDPAATQEVYDRAVAMAAAQEAEIAALEAQAHVWLAAHVPADLVAAREREAQAQRERDDVAATAARIAAREAEVQGLAQARAAFEAGARIVKLEVTCDDRRYNRGRVWVIRADGSQRVADSVDRPGNRDSDYTWNQITDEVVLVHDVTRVSGAAGRWLSGGTGVVWRPNGVTPAQVVAVEMIEKGAGIAVGTFEVDPELVERRKVAMGEIRNEILRFSPKESKVQDLRFLDVSSEEGWRMYDWWGGYDSYTSPARARVQELQPPVLRGTPTRVVHSVRCAGGVLEFLVCHHHGAPQLNARWREFTGAEKSGPVKSTTVAKSEKPVAIAAGITFTHAGNRDFRCVCGCRSRLEKSQMDQYQAGEVVAITCGVCGKSGEARKS